MTSGVPEDLNRKLYPSLRHDAYPQANAELRATFAVPSTLDEFIHAIASLPTNLAAGPTGLTYNMMKRWSRWQHIECRMCSLTRCTYQSGGDRNGLLRYQRHKTIYRLCLTCGLSIVRGSPKSLDEDHYGTHDEGVASPQYYS